MFIRYNTLFIHVCFLRTLSIGLVNTSGLLFTLLQMICYEWPYKYTQFYCFIVEKLITVFKNEAVIVPLK